MLATSKNALFPGHNHLLATRTDDPTLWLSSECQWAKIYKQPRISFLEFLIPGTCFSRDTLWASSIMTSAFWVEYLCAKGKSLELCNRWIYQMSHPCMVHNLHFTKSFYSDRHQDMMCMCTYVQFHFFCQPGCNEVIYCFADRVAKLDINRLSKYWYCTSVSLDFHFLFFFYSLLDIQESHTYLWKV